MKKYQILFVPSHVPEYSFAAPPQMLPVSINGRHLCNAVYDDGRYAFYLPERVEGLISRGLVTMRIVFLHPDSGESYRPRAGSELARIQIEAEPDVLDIGAMQHFRVPQEAILEL